MLPLIFPALALDVAQPSPKLIYPTRPHIIRPSAQETAALDPLLLAGVGPIAAARRRSGTVVPLTSPLDLAGCSFWYDFTDVSTLFQNQAGTTPVTTSLHPIGRVNDKSGNSRVLSQGTSAARPTWQSVSGYFSATFNGFNHVLQHALANTPVATVFAVVRLITAGSDNFAGLITNLTSQASGVDFVWVRDSTNNQWLALQATGDGLSDGSHFWVNRSQSVAWSSSTPAVYAVDGTGHSSPVLPTGMNLGLDRGIAGRYIEANVYEIFGYDTILSAGDRARAEQYLGNKYGITLP